MVTMTRWFWILGALALACASQQAPAEQPEAQTETPEAATAAEPSAEPAPSKAPASNSAGAPDRSADLQTVLQLVIDDEALTPYLHLEQPDRFPLRIAGRDLPAGIALTKATQPVIVIADPSKEKKPVLVFTEISVNGDEASVRYRYDVEKVRGSSSLRRKAHGWELSRSRVTEH